MWFLKFPSELQAMVYDELEKDGDCRHLAALSVTNKQLREAILLHVFQPDRKRWATLKKLYAFGVGDKDIINIFSKQNLVIAKLPPSERPKLANPNKLRQVRLTWRPDCGFETIIFRPLDAAAARGSVDMIKFLINRGGRVHSGVIETAIYAGQIETAKYLINHAAMELRRQHEAKGTSPNKPFLHPSGLIAVANMDPCFHKLAFIAAASVGSIAMVDWLLAEKPDLIEITTMSEPVPGKVWYPNGSSRALEYAFASTEKVWTTMVPYLQSRGAKMNESFERDYPWHGTSSDGRVIQWLEFKANGDKIVGSSTHHEPEQLFNKLWSKSHLSTPSSNYKLLAEEYLNYLCQGLVKCDPKQMARFLDISGIIPVVGIENLRFTMDLKESAFLFGMDKDYLDPFEQHPYGLGMLDVLAKHWPEEFSSMENGLAFRLMKGLKAKGLSLDLEGCREFLMRSPLLIKSRG